MRQVGVGDQAVHRQRFERRKAQEHGVERKCLAELIVMIEVPCHLLVQILVRLGLQQAQAGSSGLPGR